MFNQNVYSASVGFAPESQKDFVSAAYDGNTEIKSGPAPVVQAMNKFAFSNNYFMTK